MAQQMFPVATLGVHEFFYVNLEHPDGIRYFGGTKSECECVAKVLDSPMGKVVTRANLLEVLEEVGLTTK